MKHFFSIKSLLVAGLLFATSWGFAQTTVSSFAELKTAFADGATDIITNDFIDVTENLELVSSVPVKITVGDRIFVAESGVLTIGNNITIETTVGNAITNEGGKVLVEAGCIITSTATAPLAAGAGTITINGGDISTSNFPAAAAGMSDYAGAGGTLIINGGVISISSTNASAFPRGIVVDYSGICIVNGGEVHADVGGGRGVSINATNSGGRLYVNGGVITAAESNGRAIQVDNNNGRLWISGSPTITGGLEAVIVQKNGIAMIQGTPELTGVIGINVQTAGTNFPRLYDCRELTPIVAAPASGSYTGEQQITLSGGTGNVDKYYSEAGGMSTTPSGTIAVTSLVYTTTGELPTSEDIYTAPVSIQLPATVIAAPLVETAIGVPATFSYTQPSGINSPKSQQKISYTGNIISFEQPVKVASVFDYTGRLILSAQNTNIVNVSGLPRGMYILKYPEGVFKFFK